MLRDRYSIVQERDKQLLFQAGCKKCKQKIEKGEVRIAKITASPFSDDGEMKNYHHPACMFETFKKARATTKIIEVSTLSDAM